MENYLSEVTCCHLPQYRMVSGKKISSTPEEEIMTEMGKWAVEKDLDYNNSKKFGFDVPVSKQETENSLRGYEYWIGIPSHFNEIEPYQLIDFKGGVYARLRVFNPFEDPFIKIPNGWNALNQFLVDNDLLTSSCELGFCLEECIETNEGTVLDLFLKVKKEF